MGVKVREKVKGSGEWWLFINHKGLRKAKRVGTGKPGKKAAELAATQIAAKLASGDQSALDDARPRAVTFQEYAEGWLKTHANQLCKFSTARIYEANLRRHVFPLLGSKPLATVNRADCR